MNDMDVRALMDQASSGPRPPSDIDVTGAVREAARIRRGRRGAAMIAVAAAVAVAVAAPVALARPAGPARDAAPATASAAGRPAAAGPVSAPDRFDPLVLRVRPGWLPDTLLDRQWELTATSQQFSGFEPGTDKGLLVDVLARGQRFGTNDHGLGLPEQPRERPAAPVAGRPAVCIGEARQAGSCSALRWEYAPGAYARVSYAGRLGTDTAATVRVLRRVAESITLVTGTPARLPFQVDLGGTGLRPTSTLVYLRDATGQHGGYWSASLQLSPTPQDNPYDFHGVTVEMLSVPGPIDKDGPVNLRVDGHAANRGHNGDEDQWLSVFNVRGSRLLVDVTMPGKDPVALYRAVHVVANPADPAGWTTHPIG